MFSVRRYFYFFFVIIVGFSCKVAIIKKEIRKRFPVYSFNERLSPRQFLDSISNKDKNWREDIIRNEIFAGNSPLFLSNFSAIRIKFRDSISQHRVILFVAPDYLAVGTDSSFFRIPMQPRTARQIADSSHCVLPTRKIADEIYKAATVRLNPIPLTEKRDSVETFYYHHQLIEAERKNRKGLIAGIKKDVVSTGGLYTYPKSNRVAIYGWHKPDGKPIQPLYLGHVDWYVDYSHGIRLVYEKMIIDGKVKYIKDVLPNEEFKKIICDETDCRYYNYQ